MEPIRRSASRARSRTTASSIRLPTKSRRLQGTLDPSDRVRLTEYLDDIREIERRIQKAEEQSANEVNLPEAPVGIPEAFEDHIKLMFDLLVLAYRAEITRISTLMYARDTSGATYPASGVRDGFHGASHHSNIRANMDRFALINKYHVQMLAYFLEKLRATPDGDGNLLDHSVVLYGSSMSNGNQHDHDPLPIVVAGGASGQLQGGRHLTFPAAHAHVESDARAARQTGRSSSELRRQHGVTGNLDSVRESEPARFLRASSNLQYFEKREDDPCGEGCVGTKRRMCLRPRAAT